MSARLRRHRQARRLSRAQLAQAMRALGARTDAYDIARWEADYYEPKLRTFAVLGRALGVSMEALLYGEAEAERLGEECGRSG